MLFERIESRGLAHFSYLIGDSGEAMVIDPRRDCDVYIDRTYPQGYRIAQILETHRNEDYVIGSVELAARTGADIWHADPQWDYRYGHVVEDGQIWKVGRLTLRAIHSPGHTPGSMSYLLHDADGHPWMLFCGDALFAGDVGRTDLMGMDRAEEMAGLLYDTLFNKLLPLGDGVLVCPAHGAGSICGTAIADRPWTTIGLERCHNPALQFTDRGRFISNYAVQLEYPPYFKQMEKLNLEGRQGSLPTPAPLSPEEFAAKEGVVLDTRNELGFGAAHVHGALSIWLEGLPGFAGWFLDYDIPILLVADDPQQAIRYLFRLGFDNVAGYLLGGMHAWHMKGLESSSIRTVTVQSLCRHLDDQKPAWILDVRSKKELISRGTIVGAHHIHITQLPDHLDEVPRDLSVYIFCGSGLRAMIAASLLMRGGWADLSVVLGGITGWNSITCPVQRR